MEYRRAAWFAPSLQLVLCHLLVLALSQRAHIVSSPQSVNVSSGDHTVFNCTAIATYINWEVNDEAVNSDHKGFESQNTIDLNVSQDLRMTALRVLGSPDNDNTSIVCVAILQLPSFVFVANRSDPVVLLVQGLLESVSDLTVVPINSTTVLISWSPPFTLEGVPILGYNVTITNTTSGENETMSVEGDTTMLYYSIDHPDPDNNFTVTVVPINGVGPGEPAFKSIQIHTPAVRDDSTSLIVSLATGSITTSTSMPELEAIMTDDITISTTVLVSSSTVTTPSVPSSFPSPADSFVISVLVSTITSSFAIILIVILSTVTVVTCCIVRYKKRIPPQDVVPVSANPAYEQVTLKSVALQENSAYSIVHTVSPPAAAVAEYENIAGLQHI